MALELDKLRNTVERLDDLSPESRKHYLKCASVALEGIAEDLPALNETDRAAVAWCIAKLLTSIRTLPLSSVDEIVTDTAIGYSLAACKLVGLL